MLMVSLESNDGKEGAGRNMEWATLDCGCEDETTGDDVEEKAVVVVTRWEEEERAAQTANTLEDVKNLADEDMKEDFAKYCFRGSTVAAAQASISFLV